MDPADQLTHTSKSVVVSYCADLRDLLALSYCGTDHSADYNGCREREETAVLLKLNAHISNCLERAANAEQRALESTDSASRSDHELLAQSWRHLARSYQFVESLERFLSETDRNKTSVLPPELQAIAEQEPAALESKPIIRRPQVRHEASFKDRLLKSAQEAREQAAGLPAGPARKRLLLKAKQSETAASIDAWVSSPGSHPPDNLEFMKKPKA